MLLVGSVACSFHDPQFKNPILGRNCVDFDIIATMEEVKSLFKSVGFTTMVPSEDGNKIFGFREGLRPVEIEIAWPGSSNEMLLKRGYQDKVSVTELGGITMDLADINTLYMLKMSHRYRKNSPHFQKTREDILKLRAVGAQITDDLQEVYKLRMKETYGYAHPKLNVGKGDFFSGDGINYVFDHDTIHLAVAYPNPPAYSHFSDGEVKVSRAKWEELPHQIKINSVIEESYVLALERSQIPFSGQLSPRDSFLIALEKVCTSITSGWWREFAWEHYDEALAGYNDDYVVKFQKGLDMGIVKPYNGKSMAMA